MSLNKTNKFTAFILIIIIAPLIGAAYGVINDQITYTISEEYYTKFKFMQFGQMYWESAENIGTEDAPEIKLVNPRLGVAAVGIYATWEVGLFIGIILGLFGVFHRTGAEMYRITLRALGITLALTALAGLAGFIYGKYFLLETPPNWWMSDSLIEKDRFIIVGSIHNFSYLGGLIGMFLGIVYTIAQRYKASTRFS